MRELFADRACKHLELASNAVLTDSYMGPHADWSKFAVNSIEKSELLGIMTELLKISRLIDDVNAL